MSRDGNAPRIIPLEEGWNEEIKAKVRQLILAEICLLVSTDTHS